MRMDRVLSATRVFGFLSLAAWGCVSPCSASIITVPPSLSPGDQYRLVFITSTTDSASSSSISDYNNFVTSVADSVAALLDFPATWTAIVSTSTQSALTNIGGDSNVPIFLLDGDEVAAGTTGLFSATLFNPIDLDENGKTLPSGSKVWTGSTSSGGIGSDPLGSSTPEYGIDSDTSSLWIADGTSITNSTDHNLYAISSILTIAGDPPASIPEPSTLGLAVLGGAVLLLVRRRVRTPA